MAYTTIDDPSAHFHTQLFSGTGSSQSVTNDGNSDLQPDWVWIKKRAGGTARNSILTDSTRGVTKCLSTSLNDGEFTNTNGLTAFNSDGFSVGSYDSVNESSGTYVAWQWKANGGTTTTNSAGANGADHESVYQANDTAGFSIVTYTSDAQSGDTIIKHGLSTAPTFMVHKARNAGSTIWWVYHKSLGNGGYVQFDGTQANQTGSTNVWRNTAPTSSVFKVGLDSIANANGRTMVAYCFAPIQGYSKFGSYTGNGNADGPFIYTGFKPAFFIIKKSSSTEDWIMFDSKRFPINDGNIPILFPNLTGAEGEDSSVAGDLLSNGFKIRATQNMVNADGGTYIYMAFAESPFVSSKGVPTTAR